MEFKTERFRGEVGAHVAAGLLVGMVALTGQW